MSLVTCSPSSKTIEKLERVGKQLGDLGVVQEEAADDQSRYAEKNGLFVLTQTSDGGAALLNRKGFRPKEFS